MNFIKAIIFNLGLLISMVTLAKPVYSDELLTKAQNGDTSAQLELADVYMFGYGVEEDEVQAESWAIKSAENGNVDAMYWLADGYVMYAKLVEDIDETDADDHYKKASNWYLKGVELNHADSIIGLADLYSEGKGGLIQDSQKALDLLSQAANLGNKEAMSKIAFMYEYGLGVNKNLELAKTWNEKAKD